MSRENSHQKAVTDFMALIRDSLEVGTSIPHKMARRSNLTASTGYRKISALEKSGFLTRDPSAIFLLGNSARKAGFTAWGFGDLSDQVPAVLRALRQKTGRTAFLGFAETTLLHVGAFSVGRGPEYAVPEPDLPFVIQQLDECKPGIPFQTSLRAAKETGQFLSPTAACFLPIRQRAGVIALCGLLGNTSGDIDVERYSAALLHAYKSIATKRGDDGN